MGDGSYAAYLEADRYNSDYDIDKGIYEGRETYKVISTDKANGSSVQCVIAVANDDDKTVEDITFDAKDTDAIFEYIRLKFGDMVDEDTELPYYQSILDWLKTACDGDDYGIGTCCEIRLIILETME